MKKLSVDEKKKIIKILKENSAVWDLSEAEHRKSTALAAGWEKISKEMKRPVAECKTIYRSFKDLARYRGRKKQCQKSGSELILDESESPETSIGNEKECAEFSVCLDFLQLECIFRIWRIILYTEAMCLCRLPQAKYLKIQ
ncbi:uncharacterized protein LOC119661366 [Hermetia illucens]|uniref:uncharacterized protein LOC119661366 n=1 Tax=Hermetia illucens TaxID=343691 RepID=UPI0018CBFDC4|nr:uncharacterized protein LOC119661366 [Hermetia illucens]